MKKDVYATPEADVVVKPDVVSPIRIYSPTQVACGTLGGPVGLIYFLMANFAALGQEEMKKRTLLLGIALIVSLIVILPLLPESFPSTPFTVVYVVIARQVAEKYQMKKTEIAASEIYDFHSNWRVLGFSLLCLAGSAIALIGPLMLLLLTGVWEPA